MSLFGWEQRQNNTRGVNIAKTELRLLEERRDNPACKDTIGIVPMFEPESMKFSRNLKYRLDGDGECDPSLGHFGGSGRERSNLVEAKRKEQNVLFRHQKQPSAVGQSGREDTSKSRQMSRWIVLIMPNTVSR